MFRSEHIMCTMKFKVMHFKTLKKSLFSLIWRNKSERISTGWTLIKRFQTVSFRKPMGEHTVWPNIQFAQTMQLRRGLTAVIVPWLLNEAISSLSILQTVWTLETPESEAWSDNKIDNIVHQMNFIFALSWCSHHFCSTKSSRSFTWPGLLTQKFWGWKVTHGRFLP